jgi:hypothetical protein
MRLRIVLCGSMLLLLLLVSCAPALEDSGPPPPPTWTPTPASTPSATPIPYRLTVHIFDDSGQPLAGAEVMLPESGSDKPTQADASGQVQWMTLGNPNATLYVSAPGYSSAVQTVALAPGLTELAVFLRPDPFALLPADACAPGETLRYMEDFQDNQARGWPEITKGVAGTANGWGISTVEEGNQAASFTGAHDGLDYLQGLNLQNFVWRLQVRTSEADGYSMLNFAQAAPPALGPRYPIQWGPGLFLTVYRLDSPDAAVVSLMKGQFQPRPQRWYYFEISDYNGQIQVWVDGRKQVDVQDKAPLPLSAIGLEAHIVNNTTAAYYFDNVSVCELSGPVTASMFNPSK